MEAKKLSRLLEARDYAGLEALLSQTPLEALCGVWPELEALEKLAVFKLLDAPRALELYTMMPFREKYLLLCGFPLQSIAPLLEGLPPSERGRFVSLPRKFYDKMFRQLVTERVDISMSPSIN